MQSAPLRDDEAEIECSRRSSNHLDDVRPLLGDGHEGHLTPWRADTVEREEGAEGNVARDVAARGGEPETRARRVADVQHHRDRPTFGSGDRRKVWRA